MTQQFGRLMLSGKKGFYEIQLLSDKPLLSKTSAVFETSSELDSFHNFGFSLSTRLLVKKLGCHQFQQLTKKGILLINYPESFIKEFIILLLFFYKGGKSSIDERAAAAMLADQMDKKLGGIATQVCG